MNKGSPQEEHIWLEWAPKLSLRGIWTVVFRTRGAAGMGQWMLEREGSGRNRETMPGHPKLEGSGSLKI
jgi:hypothetical protein